MSEAGVEPAIYEWISEDDPRMPEALELRYRVLYEPFGVARADWDGTMLDARHLIAIHSGVVAGYACLLIDGSTARVRQVCVAPEFCGRNIGAGLMAEVEREAARAGIRDVWLESRLPAEGFYVRCGYHRIGEVFPSGSIGLPHVRMEKRLAT